MTDSSFTSYGREMSFEEWLAELVRLHPKANFCIHDLDTVMVGGPTFGAFDDVHDNCYGAYNSTGSYFAWIRNAGHYKNDLALMTPEDKKRAGIGDVD
jgi:hypothetical protein